MIEQYWLRAVAISFASFATLYFAISGATYLVWKFARGRKPRSAEFLFALVVSPILLSFAVVVALVLPSFLLFEPTRAAEFTDGEVLVFAVIGVLIVAAGLCRAAYAWFATHRSANRWRRGSVPVDVQSELPIYSTSEGSPAAVVAGIARPKLLISRSVLQALTTNELRLVVAHEIEHARRRDNLRKLLLAADLMPFRRAMGEEWMLASELKADRGAVANGYDACDLAGALVKVSRMACIQSRWATNFAAATPAMLEMRVKRLISWEPQLKSERWTVASEIAIYATAALSLTTLIYSENLLQLVHRISEFFIS